MMVNYILKYFVVSVMTYKSIIISIIDFIPILLLENVQEAKTTKKVKDR